LYALRKGLVLPHQLRYGLPQPYWISPIGQAPDMGDGKFPVQDRAWGPTLKTIGDDLDGPVGKGPEFFLGGPTGHHQFVGRLQYFALQSQVHPLGKGGQPQIFMIADRGPGISEIRDPLDVVLFLSPFPIRCRLWGGPVLITVPIPSPSMILERYFMDG